MIAIESNLWCKKRSYKARNLSFGGRHHNTVIGIEKDQITRLRN